MRKKIYTANEEMNGVGSSLLFSIIWYLSLIRYILLYGFEVSLLIFLVAGILVPAQAIRTIQRARYYRKFHDQCVREGRPAQGRIINITREYSDEYDSENRRRRKTYYYLIVDVINPDTGISQTIKSEPYRIPVYKYLATPYVQVYTDRNGWKQVIDGFQLKSHRNEPDIPLENSNVYLKDFNQPSVLARWIFVIVLVLILLQMFGILR